MSKLVLTKGKYDHLVKLSNKNHVIGALAIDQRGSLKKMIAAGNPNVKGDEGIIRFKELISEELTKYSSSILLDPEYGLPAAKLRRPYRGSAPQRGGQYRGNVDLDPAGKRSIQRTCCLAAKPAALMRDEKRNLLLPEWGGRRFCFVGGFVFS